MSQPLNSSFKISGRPNTNWYTVKCLIGNWSDARFDHRYRDDRSRLISDLERHWQSEYGSAIGAHTLPTTTAAAILTMAKKTASAAETAATGTTNGNVGNDDAAKSSTSTALPPIASATVTSFTGTAGHGGGYSSPLRMKWSTQTFSGTSPFSSPTAQDGSSDRFTSVSESHDQFQDPTTRPIVVRKFVGGKGIPSDCKHYDNRSFEERAAEYTETWTRSSLKTREKMISESHRSLVKPKQQINAGSRTFGIPVVDRIRGRIWRRAGKSGLRYLHRLFRAIDENGNKMLDRTEMQKGLALFGLHLSQSELNDVMSYFDTNNSGTISVEEFVQCLRSPMSERRRELVVQAYRLLDSKFGGKEQVTVADMLKLYDTTKHPDVLTKSKSREQVMQEFVRGWEDKAPTDWVSAEEFLDYYADVGSGIGNDEFFELMVRNTWHVSGGEGPCQNTSCRRVLVIHTSGAQTVEEIKNDLHIGVRDMPAMIENLKAQGIADIKRVDLYERVN